MPQRPKDEKELQKLEAIGVIHASRFVRKYSRTNKPITVLIGLVFFIIYAILSFNRNLLDRDFYDKETQTPMPTFSNKNEIDSLIDMTDWNTYKDPWYGFELKYPNGWNQEKTDHDGVYSICFNPTEHSCSIAIAISRDNQDFITYIEGKRKFYLNWKTLESQLNIAGEDAILFSVIAKPEDFSKNYELYAKDLFFRHNERLYQIRSMSGEEDKFDFMIKSFNFFEPKLTDPVYTE